MSEEYTLPKGWINTTLEEVTSPVRIIIQPSDKPELPFIGLEHVEAETMKLLSTARFGDMRSHAFNFKPNNVLYGRLRPYLNKVFRSDTEGACSAEFIVFPEGSHLNARYLQYFLNSWRFKEFAAHLNAGDRPRVDWDQLKIFPFPFPPPSEQLRIVEVIERHFSRLDVVIAELRQKQKQLKRYHASVLKAAVEGVLTAQWRAEHSDVEPTPILLQHILEERRAQWEADLIARGKDPKKVNYVKPAAPDVETLGTLPDGWCWATVDQLAASERNSLTDGPFGSNLKTKHYTSEGARVIRLQNIGDGIFKDEKAFISFEHFETLKKYNIFPGDLVIATLGGNPPRSCIIPDFIGPAIVKADCIRYKVSSSVINIYINIALNADPTRKRTTSKLHGIGRPRLNLREIKQITLPLPPFEEQEQIVAEVEKQLSLIKHWEDIVEAHLSTAQGLRQTILREAFAGRLVEQDPTEEPVNELFECIRAEREKLQNSVSQPLQHLHPVLVSEGRPQPIDPMVEQRGLWVELDE